jgi:hypothetical protein
MQYFLYSLVRAALILVAIVLLFICAFSWFAGETSIIIWIFRLVSLPVAIFILSYFLWQNYHKDYAHNFIREQFGKAYFTKHGLSIGISLETVAGTAYLNVYYQNHYSRPCEAKIRIKPSRQWFGHHRRLVSFGNNVNVAAREYGALHIPIPIPLKYQGKKQSYDVGITTRFPDGYGKQLIFKQGLYASSYYSVMDNAIVFALVFILLLPFMVILLSHTPSACTFILPENVQEILPDDMEFTQETLWSQSGSSELMTG